MTRRAADQHSDRYGAQAKMRHQTSGERIVAFTKARGKRQALLEPCPLLDGSGVKGPRVAEVQLAGRKRRGQFLASCREPDSHAIIWTIFRPQRNMQLTTSPRLLVSST